MLYEHIAVVRILADGELMGEFNLAELFSKLEFNNSFGNVIREYRLATWQQWIKRTENTRKELGLGVC